MFQDSFLDLLNLKLLTDVDSKMTFLELKWHVVL